ncbi:MAG: right-handed parallel beta-helix repeat-containing protein, partial [Phycisphaerae bacterium]|nr:right-handed parallel beta-helix repeat-containing protein [Phycisphaerae bacterium]
IQRGIDAASDGTEVIVAPGIYYETINFLGKAVTVKSSDGADTTYITDCNSGSVVSFIHGEISESILEGFTLTRGIGTSVVYGPSGGGVFCQNSSPAILNCRILCNNVGSGSGGGIACYDSSPIITNCVISDNSAQYGGGIYCVGNSSPIISNTIISQNGTGLYGSGIYCDYDTSPIVENCTIADNNNGVYCYMNGNATIRNSILWNNGDDLYNCSATYSCVDNNDLGIGNVNSTPLFVGLIGYRLYPSCVVSSRGRSDVGPRPTPYPIIDYHLLPDSPCIDAGAPNLPWENEPWPNGGRINMGAYGNTSEASRSRDGLLSAGFQIMNKTRTGRTAFEYELALRIQNQNNYDVTNVQARLINATNMISVTDDSVSFETIIAEHSAISNDTFKIVVDRSQLIEPGHLTWELIWYDVSDQQGNQTLSMNLSLDKLEGGISGDITGDGKVNFDDLRVLSEQWLQPPGMPSADIAPVPADGFVNFLDFALLAENWMK